MGYYDQPIIALQTSIIRRCRQAQSRARVRRLFSHVTALQLLGVELPKGLQADTRLHIAVATRNHKVRVKGAACHVWRPRFKPWVVKGVQCVHPLDAWLQCVGVLTAEEIVVLAESIIRKGLGLVARDFRAALSRKAYVRGQKKCRVKQIRDGTDSSQETRLRLALVAAGLGCPRVNYEPGLQWGTGYPLKFDLAYPRARLLIEYDGRHHEDEAQRRRDNAKRSWAVADGWRVLVFDSENSVEAVRLVRKLLLGPTSVGLRRRE